MSFLGTFCKSMMDHREISKFGTSYVGRNDGRRGIPAPRASPAVASLPRPLRCTKGALFCQPRGNLHDRIFDGVAEFVNFLRGDGQRRGHWQDVAANPDPDAAAFQRVGKSPSDTDFGRERRGFCCCGAMFAGSVGSN